MVGEAGLRRGWGLIRKEYGAVGGRGDFMVVMVEKKGTNRGG